METSKESPISNSKMLEKKERSSNYILELSQKFDFQPSTIKLDNMGHPTVETGHI